MTFQWKLSKTFFKLLMLYDDYFSTHNSDIYCAMNWCIGEICSLMLPKIAKFATFVYLMHKKDQT